MKDKKCVYCSGPMFTEGNLNTQLKIATEFEKAGYDTYLPQRDGIEVGKVMGLMQQPELVLLFSPVMKLVMKIVAALDIYQVIERCDYLVFNMNGAVPDDGSVAETAAAFAAGKPIVIYRNDPRTEFNGFMNPLTSSLSYTWKFITDINALPLEMEKTIQLLEKEGPNPYPANWPPHIARICKNGKNIWEILQAWRGQGEHSDENKFFEVVKVILEEIKDSSLVEDLKFIEKDMATIIKQTYNVFKKLVTA